VLRQSFIDAKCSYVVRIGMINGYSAYAQTSQTRETNGYYVRFIIRRLATQLTIQLRATRRQF